MNMVTVLDCAITGSVCLWLGGFLSDLLWASERMLAALAFIGAIWVLALAIVLRICIACGVHLVVSP